MDRKRCVLYDRECIECGECNMCDLDPSKICDNCGKCIGLGGDTEYRAIKVDGIIREDMDPNEYLYDEATLEDDGLPAGENLEDQLFAYRRQQPEKNE